MTKIQRDFYVAEHLKTGTRVVIDLGKVAYFTESSQKLTQVAMDNGDILTISENFDVFTDRLEKLNK